MIFGVNTTSDISKLLYVILRAVRRVKFETFLKYNVQILLLFVYTTTRKRFVIFTCRYFKLSRNTVDLSQSNCRNFSCSSINPLSLKSDQHQFSPHNINILSREMVMRFNRMNDHLRENALIFYQILSTNSLRKCTEISLENLYVDIGASSLYDQ